MTRVFDRGSLLRAAVYLLLCDYLGLRHFYAVGSNPADLSGDDRANTWQLSVRIVDVGFFFRIAIMGVPALFRWLSNKYPKIISSVIEQLPYEVDGEEIPVDTTGPNPNGEEMDNLYLDMNGIVHPCTHPEGKPPPANEQEMMLEIFKYTDRVVNMVRPRKLLMIAVGM